MTVKFSKIDIVGMKLKRERIIRKPQPLLIGAPKIRLPRFSHWPKIVSFAAFIIIITLVLQGLTYLSKARSWRGEILGVATSAYSDLAAGGENLSQQNLSSASKLFASASQNINLALDKLNDYKLLTWAYPQASSADHILSGAGFLARAGQRLSSALSLFEELKVSSKGIETIDFELKLSINQKYLIESRNLVQQASDEFSKVSSVPLDYTETLTQAKIQVAQLARALDQLIGLESVYLEIFSGEKIYLLVFQNYDELRATGGFIGTYGVLKTNHGMITNLSIDSIYDLDSQIYEQIAAPGPMQPEIPRWGIRDANWFADFPTTATKLLYFFEKGSQTADGVIAITPQLFENLLDVVGPIDMPEYDTVLTTENFQKVAQQKTSVEYDRQLNEPKKFLADLAPILLDRLINLEKDQWLGVLQILQNNLQQRQILLFSKDLITQRQISDLGFSGEILSTEYDYISIINSNLGGTKTDLNMDQGAKLESKILSDGSIINNLTIRRTNAAAEENKNYMRVLVPLGSQLVSASGFDEHQYFDSVSRDLNTDPDLAAWDDGSLHSNAYVRTETGKTEFAGWVITSPGEEQTVTLTYVLPFKASVDHGYCLLVQKQSGAKAYQFDGNLNLGQFRTNWLGPNTTLYGNIVQFSSHSNTDDFWPMVITK